MCNWRVKKDEKLYKTNLVSHVIIKRNERQVVQTSKTYNHENEIQDQLILSKYEKEYMKTNIGKVIVRLDKINMMR